MSMYLKTVMGQMGRTQKDRKSFPPLLFGIIILTRNITNSPQGLATNCRHSSRNSFCSRPRIQLRRKRKCSPFPPNIRHDNRFSRCPWSHARSPRSSKHWRKLSRSFLTRSSQHHGPPTRNRSLLPRGCQGMSGTIQLGSDERCASCF